MDVFSLLMFRLESYILRIRDLYLYIFKFFLPGTPDDGPEEDDDIISDKHGRVHL